MKKKLKLKIFLPLAFETTTTLAISVSCNTNKQEQNEKNGNQNPTNKTAEKNNKQNLKPKNNKQTNQSQNNPNIKTDKKESQDPLTQQKQNDSSNSQNQNNSAKTEQDNTDQPQTQKNITDKQNKNESAKTEKNNITQSQDNITDDQVQNNTQTSQDDMSQSQSQQSQNDINQDQNEQDNNNQINNSQNLPENNHSKQNGIDISQLAKEKPEELSTNKAHLANDNATNSIDYQFSDLNVNVYNQTELFPSRVSQIYADFLTKKNNSKLPNEQFKKYVQTQSNAQFLNSRANGNNVEVFFKINSNDNNFELSYTEDNSNVVKSINLEKLQIGLYKGLINLSDNVNKITLKSLKNMINNTVLISSFETNGQIDTEKNEVNQSALNYYSYSKWTKTSKKEKNVDMLKFAFDISQVSNSTTTSATFQIKYFNNSGQEITKKFDKFDLRGTDRRFRVSLPKNDIKWIKGIYLQNNLTGSKYVKLNLSTNEILNPSLEIENLTNLTITSLNKENTNNKIILNYLKQNNFTLTAAKALVKSSNPFEPWSKIIDLEINQNQLSFDKSVLPSHLNSFVITDVQLNNEEIINLGLKNNNYIFEIAKNIPDNSVSLSAFDVFKDEQNKRIYGSLKLNFNQSNIEKFRDKWILLEFNLDQISDSSPASFQFETKYKTVVKFEDYAKFGLNGFDEGVNFSLIKASFVSPYNLNSYSKINLDQLSQKTFRYYFNYDDVGIKQKLNLNNQSNLDNQTYSKLLSTSLNLTKNDLFELVNKDTTNDTILYSEQNFYAWLRYSRYVTREKSNNLKKIKMIDPSNGQEIKYQVVLGKEILANTLWNFNDNHTQATIEKDLDVYQNWDNFSDQTIFSLKFGFDLNKIKLQDYYNLDLKKLNKSNLTISFSYADFKKLNQNESLIPAVDFDAKIDTLSTNEWRLKAILYNYGFRVIKLDNKKVKFIVFAKKEQTHLSDNPSVQYFANHKSALLNDARLLIEYPEFQNQTYNVSFNSKALKNGAVSISTNKTLLDKNNIAQGLNTTSFHDYKLTGSKADEIPARRLFKEDATAGGLKSVRERVFSLNNGSSSSNSILGRVNPKNDNDFRFYFITNTHVLKQFKNLDINPSLDHDYTRKITVNFRIPIEFAKPADYETNGSKNPFTSELFWSQGFDANLEVVSDYRDRNSFWNFNKFKDGYGNDLSENEGARRIDMSIAIIDLSSFFIKYDNNSTAFNNLNEKDKKIAKYILNWKNLPMIKASKESYHVNDYTNLNWFFGGFPVDGNFTTNKDNARGQRYREYLFAHTQSIQRKVHGNTSVRNNAIAFPKSITDTNGGASGSSVYDSQGNLAALYSAADPGANGYGYSYIINGNKYDFYSDGTRPFNQASFYEKIRLLAYLYPNRYNQKDFNEKGFWFI
ncbi:hypothetical protein EG856_00765 [Mycoplasmopsis phocirhinis]|uniref:DUF31 domain-containing protein n=1 Tax=Mycoplasmopsis phocirhinis TaxID=142650 RepID=A0A4P6MRK8_9BACT|nr:hypothetical protein [Mycoplasmopsis phocirhinis]QBF34461.1 hypothetical protein EG856_00765 [Mycoplasmopsis phocirhinis]